jgi:glycosyltransferase involved in cell wall biosynthesis
MAEQRPDIDLISVVIPAFNAEPYIAETLESALRQTDHNFEIIVVDDGSTDRTREIIRRYAPRVRLIEQQNKGPAAARNLLLTEAQGKYVAFLDADDVWLPGKLAAQRKLFQDYPDLVLVSARLRDVDATGQPLGNREDPRYQPLYDQPRHLHRVLLHVGNMIAQSAAMAVRAQVLAAGGWYSAERILSTDYELWIRIAERGRFFVSSEIVGDYRVLERSLSHGSVPREYSGQKRIVDMYRQHFTPAEYRRRISHLYFDWAESAFVKGEPGAWPVIRDALRLDPLNTDAWFLAAKRGVVSLIGRG